MLFPLAEQTPHVTFIAIDPARVREVLAVFEAHGTAQSYARAHNDTHAWTNRATRARVISDGTKLVDFDGFTISRYVVVRGTLERGDLKMFESFQDGEKYVASADQSQPLALFAMPFFDLDQLHPVPPEPGGQWSAAFFTADLALFADTSEGCHVLLIRRAADSDAEAGKWALPGGFVDPDETGQQAAVRETREETGIEVPAASLVLATVADHPDRDPRGRIVSHVYTTTLDHMPTPAAGDDADRAEWIPLMEALAGRQLAFDHAKLLRTAAVMSG